jgi:2-polyprenyl-3-methyl-5-hydroxy-6-metoxy-1,4-benzoquinol methylase
LGFEVNCATTNELEIPSHKYEIVMMLDYLEHTYTPMEDLNFAFTILSDDGVLLLKTLYLGCPDHKKLKEKWKLLGADHFHFFFPSVLKKMIEAAGFEIVDQKLGQLIHFVAKKK